MSGPTPSIFALTRFSAGFFWKILKAPIFIEGSTLLFHIWCFQWGIQSWLKKLMALYMWLCLQELYWYYWRSLLLSLGSYDHPAAIVGYPSWGIILGDFVTFWKGLQSFWRNCVVMASYVLVSILPTFCSCYDLTNKFLKGDINFSSTGFIFCCPIYSYYVEEERLR